MLHLNPALLLVSLLASVASASSTPAQDLLAAAKAKDTPKLAAALDAGADVNARDAQGRTALMLAAEAEAFGACRELLWAGADANALDKAGRTALQHAPAQTQANVPLHFLLRCYAFLQTNALRSKARPEHPSLVMINESTVNYLHPKLQAAYELNKLEFLGNPGVDDDADGFVDDVYGWDPVQGKPYEIRPSQVDAYKQYREPIARILQIDEDRAQGKLTRAEFELRLAEYTNPLADLMGPLAGLSDMDFLNLLKLAAHGSHVAGIVLESSEGKATLHTLSLNFAEESRRLLGPGSDAVIDQFHEDSFMPEVMLGYLRARLLENRTERGRTISRYLRATGAGVMNLSWGGGIAFWKAQAKEHIQRCLQDRARTLPFKVKDPDVAALTEHWGLELYTAAALPIALAAYENPDVLFVVSAGNEGANNDEELPTPAYLARFFPNVITVASTDSIDQLSRFSNFGGESVDIGAPGEEILSTLFPEASVRMSGTSMAAPCVAGVAALMRSIAPQVSAAELRRLIDLTAREVEFYHGLLVSAGVLDRDVLRGCFGGAPRAQSNAQARIACNLSGLPDDCFPRRANESQRAAERAVTLDKTNPEAWRARAVVLTEVDAKKAFEAIERSVQLDPNCEPAWMQRALIGSRLKDNRLLFESLGKSIDVLAPRKGLAVFVRAQRLILRASLHLQLQEVEPARADVRLARQLNPQAELPPELEALL